MPGATEARSRTGTRCAAAGFLSPGHRHATDRRPATCRSQGTGALRPRPRKYRHRRNGQLHRAQHTARRQLEFVAPAPARIRAQYRHLLPVPRRQRTGHRLGRQVEGQQEVSSAKHTLEQQHRLGAFKESDAAVQGAGWVCRQARNGAARTESRVALLPPRPRRGARRGSATTAGRKWLGQRHVGPRHRRAATITALVRPEVMRRGPAGASNGTSRLGQAQLRAWYRQTEPRSLAQHRHQHPRQARIGRDRPSGW